MSEPVFNPWLTIWTAPRITVRRIAAINPAHSVHVLAALGGIASLFDAAAYRGAGARFAAPIIVLAGIVFGTLFGLARLYVAAAALAWTGRWFGGRADARLIRCALAWSQVPAIASLLLWLAGLAIIGADIFMREPSDLEVQGRAAFYLIWGLAMLLLRLASLLIHLHTVAEVQGFSAWMALANIAVAMLILAVPVALLAQFVGVGLFAVR